MAHRDPKYSMTLRLPPELTENLKTLAERNHRSLNAEILHALEKYMKDSSQSDVDKSDGRVVS